ncbi:hypothetical protein ACWEWQ_40755, partial [Streptomyces sp. NPDC003832]
MVDSSAEPLDQLLFRWEGNQNQYVTGIAAAAYSCGDQRAEDLKSLLAPLLRVEGEGSRRSSLVRCLVPGTREAVLIHRRPAQDARGRDSTVSRALVGSARVLTARESISLSTGDWEWTGVPEDATGRLDPLPVDVLRRQFRAARPLYVENVPHIADRLEVAVAQLLRTPLHRLTFRRRDISKDEESSYAPLLIWGLCSMLGPWLGDEAFTFASFDTQEHAGLRLVCVPEWPRSAVGGSAAQRITFAATVQDQARAVAAELVALFLREPERPERLGEVLKACHGPCTRSLRDRLATLERALRGDLSGDRAAVTGGLRPGIDLLKSTGGFGDGVPRGSLRAGGGGTVRGAGQSAGASGASGADVAGPGGPVPEPAGHGGSGRHAEVTAAASEVQEGEVQESKLQEGEVQEAEQGHAPEEMTVHRGGTPPAPVIAPPASAAEHSPHGTPPRAPRPESWQEPHAPAGPAPWPVAAGDPAQGQTASAPPYPPRTSPAHEGAASGGWARPAAAGPPRRGRRPRPRTRCAAGR